MQPWCSRSHFPFCWWTMEIQYRLLARILNLLNVSIEHIKIIVGIFERVACIEHLNEWILNILTHIVKIEQVQHSQCGAGFMNLFAYQTILHKHEVVKQSKDTINNWRQNEFTKWRYKMSQAWWSEYFYILQTEAKWLAQL